MARGSVADDVADAWRSGRCGGRGSTNRLELFRAGPIRYEYGSLREILAAFNKSADAHGIRTHWSSRLRTLAPSATGVNT
jgi:hypothetical protein